MDERIRNSFLHEHIPYRLNRISEIFLIDQLRKIGGESEEITILVDRHTKINASSIHFFTDPIYETTLIFIRVMLEFLGLKLNSKNSEIIERGKKQKQDDVVIEDFGLKKISLGEVGSPKNLECLAHTIRCAHKAVAHLTKGPKTEWDFNKNLYSAKKVIELINNNLYKSLRMPPIKTSFSLDGN